MLWSLWNGLRSAVRSVLPGRTPGLPAVTLMTLALGVGIIRPLEAQPPRVADRLVSSWILVSVDKQAGTDAPVRARLPRGLLVLDGAGNVFELFSATPARAEGAAVPTGALLTLEEYGGFWGRYTVDESTGRMNFAAEAGVSPSVQGLSFSRSFELDGDQLVITSTREPLAQSDTRWTWQRFPTVENLSPAYREVVGFWRNVGERQVDLATGAIQRESQRGPSVIVYTPAGFVGVHFPPRMRESFAGEAPTAAEAQAAMRGYIGYFGSLGVYPGEVSHNILAGVSPTSGTILRRYAEITGDKLVVRLQGGAPRTAGDDRPQTATEVLLDRLSGAEDMLPR
jgi:lipocalin-like protein